MDFFTPTILLGRAIGLLLGFTLHEWAHAYTAYRIGGYRALPDPTRLSLDPRVHIEPLGIVLALVAGFGWAKPVPVNPNAFYPNQRRDMMLVAFAGPLTNLIIALVCGILLRLLLTAGVLVDTGLRLVDSGAMVVEGSSGVFTVLYEIMATVVFFNVLLCLFNLVPLAPLDGWKVLLGLLPKESAYELSRYEQQSTMLLILLILFGFVGPSVIFVVIEPALDAIFELLTGFGYYIR